MSAPPLLVCGDLGHGACGVGASEAAARRPVALAVVAVDPTRVRAARDRLRDARREGRPVVVTFPTRSTVRSPRALAVMATAAGAADVRWHLHEYSIFGERRVVLDSLLRRSRGTVVVSTEGEADALRAARGGRVAARCRIEVVPPANGTPALAAPVAPADPPVVGVFGTARADKGPAFLVDALRALPAAFATVETVGRGWDAVPWPDDVRARFALRHHGWQEAGAAAAVMGPWTLAVAPFVGGATDGRMSLRTPLALGVPTLTHVERPADLTLRPRHLLLDPATAGPAALGCDRAARRAGADEVARFEADAVAALGRVLWPEAVAAAAEVVPA